MAISTSCFLKAHSRAPQNALSGIPKRAPWIPISISCYLNACSCAPQNVLPIIQKRACAHLKTCSHVPQRVLPGTAKTSKPQSVLPGTPKRAPGHLKACSRAKKRTPRHIKACSPAQKRAPGHRIRDHACKSARTPAGTTCTQPQKFSICLIHILCEGLRLRTLQINLQGKMF